jgi:hypothetical protein
MTRSFSTVQDPPPKIKRDTLETACDVQAERDTQPHDSRIES